jgi:uncharacterized membrane protein YccC
MEMTIFVLIFLLLGSLILLVACVAGVAAFVGVVSSWYPAFFLLGVAAVILFSVLGAAIEDTIARSAHPIAQAIEKRARAREHLEDEDL